MFCLYLMGGSGACILLVEYDLNVCNCHLTVVHIHCILVSSLEIGFEGFNTSMKNETVMVRLGQAVGLRCGYMGTPVPDPEVTWLKDEVPIAIDSTATVPHYRVLDKGELIIYDLMMIDIQNADGELAEYRCRVDNVRMVENETAPFFYTLNDSSELHI